MTDDTAGRRRPIDVDMRGLHELHAARMATWELPHGDVHESDVVNRVVDWVRGVADRPTAHAHAHVEMGMCATCDAAALIEQAYGEWRA